MCHVGVTISSDSLRHPYCKVIVWGWNCVTPDSLVFCTHKCPSTVGYQPCFQKSKTMISMPLKIIIFHTRIISKSIENLQNLRHEQVIKLFAAGDYCDPGTLTFSDFSKVPEIWKALFMRKCISWLSYKHSASLTTLQESVYWNLNYCHFV